MNFFGIFTDLQKASTQPSAAATHVRIPCSLIKVICIPSFTDVRIFATEGSNLNDSEAWSAYKNDLFVSAEQTLKSYYPKSKEIKQMVTVAGLIEYAQDKHKIAVVDESERSDEPTSFIPLSLLVGDMLLKQQRLVKSEKIQVSQLTAKYMEILTESNQLSSSHQRGSKSSASSSSSSSSSNNNTAFPIQQKLASIGMTYAVFEELQKRKYFESFKLMRSYIPENILTLEDRLDTLLSDGVPSSIVQRVLTHKILWLICMHPSDLEKMHITQLTRRYKYSSLDIVEMRAVWHCLPQWAEGTHNNVWRMRFKHRLDEMMFSEMVGGLIPLEQIRNPVYQNDGSNPLYNHTAEPSPLPSHEDTSREEAILLSDPGFDPEEDHFFTSLSEKARQLQQQSTAKQGTEQLTADLLPAEDTPCSPSLLLVPPSPGMSKFAPPSVLPAPRTLNNYSSSNGGSLKVERSVSGRISSGGPPPLGLTTPTKSALKSPGSSQGTTTSASHAYYSSSSPSGELSELGVELPPPSPAASKLVTFDTTAKTPPLTVPAAVVASPRSTPRLKRKLSISSMAIRSVHSQTHPSDFYEEVLTSRILLKVDIPPLTLLTEETETEREGRGGTVPHLVGSSSVGLFLPEVSEISGSPYSQSHPAQHPSTVESADSSEVDRGSRSSIGFSSEVDEEEQEELSVRSELSELASFKTFEHPELRHNPHLSGHNLLQLHTHKEDAVCTDSDPPPSVTTLDLQYSASEDHSHEDFKYFNSNSARVNSFFALVPEESSGARSPSLFDAYVDHNGKISPEIGDNANGKSEKEVEAEAVASAGTQVTPTKGGSGSKMLLHKGSWYCISQNDTPKASLSRHFKSVEMMDVNSLEEHLNTLSFQDVAESDEEYEDDETEAGTERGTKGRYSNPRTLTDFDLANTSLSSDAFSLLLNSAESSLLHRRLKKTVSNLGDSEFSDFSVVLVEIVWDHLLSGDVKGAIAAVEDNKDVPISSESANRIFVKLLQNKDKLDNVLEAFTFAVEVLKADVCSVTDRGLNALHVFCENPSVGHFFLSRGCDMLHKDTDGVTALEYCLKSLGSPRSAKQLVPPSPGTSSSAASASVGTAAPPWIVHSIKALCKAQEITAKELLNRNYDGKSKGVVLSSVARIDRYVEYSGIISALVTAKGFSQDE